MSDSIAKSLSGSLQFTFSLVDKFIEVCPDSLWGKKFGGWLVWQQLYHPFAAVDFFLRPAGAPPAPSPFEEGAADLKISATQVPDKALVRDLIAKAQKQLLDYVAGINDAAMGQKNDGPSSRMGRDLTHAAVIAMISGHALYHLGSCDAALREHGMPGVF